MTRVAIVGVGGQGRECLDIAEAMADSGSDIEVMGFFDDAPSEENLERLRARGQRHLGSVADLLSATADEVCLGVGDGAVRARLDALLLHHGITGAVLIHPQSSIGSEVQLSPGVVVFGGARLTTNIRLGRHVHVNQNATVGHDCTISDFATVNPQAAISGAVQLGRESLVGAGAVVLQGLTVGERAKVGAGACVGNDVADDSVVKGVPAR
jgi:sugar O-acyltransferase (sialic acid O-acetyltransferase NeuD family)